MTVLLNDGIGLRPPATDRRSIRSHLATTVSCGGWQVAIPAPAARTAIACKHHSLSTFSQDTLHADVLYSIYGTT